MVPARLVVVKNEACPPFPAGDDVQIFSPRSEGADAAVNGESRIVHAWQ